MNTIDQARAKTWSVVAAAERMYNVDFGDVEVRFDLRGKCAGIAMRRKSKFIVRLNVDFLADDRANMILNDTIPHEVAHLVCFARPELGRNHDSGWARICRGLGGTGATRHNEEVTYAKGNTYEYITTAGHAIRISEQRHKRIQQGVVYRTRSQGALDRTCAFNIVNGAVTVAKEPAAGPARQLPANAQGTNAERVRARIALAKQQNETPATVVEWAIVTLGQSRSLAKSYVTNNWHKV